MISIRFLMLTVIGSVIISLAACKYNNEYQTVNAANKFSVSVPSWMKEETDLKPGADFQYANRFRNFYAIGETLNKADLKRTNSELMNDYLTAIRKSMTKATVTDSVEVQGGGIKGTRVEIYGKMGGENIYFSEVLFEGEKNLYHLSIWTRSEDRKLHFKEDINKIIASLKEI